MSVRERRVSAEHGAIQRFAASTVTYVHAQSPSFRCKFFRGSRMGFSRFAVIITDVFYSVNPRKQKIVKIQEHFLKSKVPEIPRFQGISGTVIF